MLEISAIPYIVFAFMAIPPFIFGYFKGWRSGVFTLLTTLAVGGILVGTSFAIYDKTLWPLFSKVFIKNHNPAGLDTEALKEISKSSVISITVGIGLVPGILVTTVLYLSLKKVFNKYMLPKIKHVSENETTIKRKNLKLTRAGGVLINGTAGLIVASAAAGAISTLTVPYKNSNFFQKFSNAIGDGMTFGQAQYDNGYQQMYDFINNADAFESQITDIQHAFGLSPSQNAFEMSKTSFDSFITETKNQADPTSDQEFNFLTRTNKMASSSEEVSKALVLLILSKTNKDVPFNLFGTSSSSEVIDINKADAKIEASLKTLEEFSKANDWGIKWNEKGVREGITEIYNTRFVDYEKSSYYMNWKTSQGKLTKAQTEEKKRKDQLKADLKYIEDNKSKPQNLINTINNSRASIVKTWNLIIKLTNKIGEGEAFVDTPTFKKLEYKLFNIDTEKDTGTTIPGQIDSPDLAVLKLNNNSGHLFSDKEAATSQLAKDETTKDEKLKNKNDAEEKLTDAKTNEEIAIKAMQDAQANEDKAKENKTKALVNKTKKEQEKTNAEKLMNDAETKESTTKFTEESFDEKLTIAKNNYDSEKSKLANARKKEESSNKKLQETEKNDPNYDSVLQNHNDAKKELNAISITYNTASKAYEKAKSDYDKKLSAYNIATKEFEDAKENYQIASSAYDTASKAYEKAVTRYSDAQLANSNALAINLKAAKQVTADAQKTYDDTLEPYEKAVEVWKASQKDLKEKNEAYQSVHDQIAALRKKIDDSQTTNEKTLNDEAGLFDKLKSKWDDKNLLKNSVATNGSIAEQIEIVKKCQTTFDNLDKIQKEKREVYKERSKRIIDALTNALS